MSSLPLSLVIEGLVAALLLVTIGYCVVLNGRLKRLRADEAGLRATIAELLTATEIAERAIHGLKTASAQCDQTLGQRVAEARQVSQELASNMDGAGALVERVGKLANVSSGRTVRRTAAANDEKVEVLARAARLTGQASARAQQEALEGAAGTLRQRGADEPAAATQKRTQARQAAAPPNANATKPAQPRPTPTSRSLDEAARYLQARLQRVAS